MNDFINCTSKDNLLLQTIFNHGKNSSPKLSIQNVLLTRQIPTNLVDMKGFVEV